MLKRVSDIQYQEEVDDFGNVLEKVSECVVIASLKQMVTNPEADADNSIDLQVVKLQARSEILMNEAFIYVSLFPVREGDMAELRRIDGIWKTALRRYTQNKIKGEKPDVLFMVELCSLEERTPDSLSPYSTAYIFSCCTPSFISVEKDELRMAFTYEFSTFGVENYLDEDMEYEIYLDEEEAIAETGIADEVENEIEETEIISNEEILDNSDILDS